MGIMEDFLSGTDENQRKGDNEKYLKELQTRVDRINGLEEAIEELEDDELEDKTKEFRERLAAGEDINGPILEEAFAVVREASWYVNCTWRFSLRKLFLCSQRRSSNKIVFC